MLPPPPLTSELTAGVAFGSYVLGELIGRGAMASVYRAEHILLKKPVALKLMDDSLLENPDARERFLREGRVVASITHPNVVDVTDVGVHEGTPYLVMELLVGEDLHSYLARNGPLDDRTTTRLALPVIAALLAAHEVNVVHRDVKPSNIFLEHGTNGEVIPKVLDFGISKLSLERTGLDLVATSPNQIIGSPLYLPPEALRGSTQLGPAADQYSLGVVLYQCVTGRTPFRGDTLLELLGALARGAFEPPRALRPDISPVLEGVILRAMALDPKERFPSLREMGAAMLALAAERTQVVWANSFKPPILSNAAQLLLLPPSSSRASRPDVSRPDVSTPNGGALVAVDGVQTTPLPELRPRRKTRWMVAGGAALLALIGLSIAALQRRTPPPLSVGVGAVAPPQPTSTGSSTGAKPASIPVPAQREPVVSAVQHPAPAAVSASDEPAPAEPKTKASNAQTRSSQSVRSAQSARERRARARRSLAETSETTAASPEGASPGDRAAQASSSTALPPSVSPPATEASEGTPSGRGANQAPFLD